MHPDKSNSFPKVSIIVPIYGVEKYLCQCVDSILAQTLKDIEIILIDDGSKDKCPEIIDTYAAYDRRVVAVHQKNSGYGKAVNYGIRLAQGEYIGIVEPDDYIKKEMYSDLYNLAKEQNADIVKSSFFHFKDTRRRRIFKVYWEKNKLPQTKEVFTLKNYPSFLSFHPSIWSCLYRAEFLKKNSVTMQEVKGAGWTDNLFQVQTMILAQRICYTPKAYYFWRTLDEDESKKLKDWRLPFQRSQEIHAWLQKNNQNKKDILSCLFKREMAYIHLVAKMFPLSEIFALAKEIRVLLSFYTQEMIEKSSFVERHEKKAFRNARAHPIRTLFKFRYWENLRKGRKFLISINFKKGFLIQFLGLQITNKTTSPPPSFSTP